jgi:hypothetical protein
MALGFGKRKNKDGTDRFPHGRASYAKEDVEDARRGRPDVDLSGFAAARGLRFRGSIRMSAFMSATPIWPDYVFNAMDGELRSGRYGLLEHELDEIGTSQDSLDEAGTFYDISYTWRTRESIGHFLSYGLIGDEGKEPNEPFKANAVWVPATGVTIRVPETSMLGSFEIRRRENLARFTSEDLDELGLPGFRARGTKRQDVEPEVLADALGGRAGDALRDCLYTYLRVEVGYGAVTLRRNGYVRDDADLDELLERASRIADGIAAACARLARPQAFDSPLPPAEPGPELSKKQRALAEIADQGVTQAGARIATELGLTTEDPRNFHRAFPELPMPGRARLVVFGRLPDSGVTARIVYSTQGIRSGSTLRGGVILPAAAAPPPGPLGGTVVESTGMYGEVAGGLAAVWDRKRVQGRLDAGDLARRALITARELGIADV